MYKTKTSFITNSTTANPSKQLGSLLINIPVNWDDFDTTANTIVLILDATVKNKDIGADRHRWQLDFDGVRLYLIYEEISDSLWLELDRLEDQETLDFIAGLLEKKI